MIDAKINQLMTTFTFAPRTSLINPPNSVRPPAPYQHPFQQARPQQARPANPLQMQPNTLPAQTHWQRPHTPLVPTQQFHQYGIVSQFLMCKD